MWQNFLFIFILCSLREICASGSVSLGEHTFDKIIRKFPAVLVKFDVAFPYGDKYDVFKKLSMETSKISDLLLAEVGIKDYGERENEVLAQRYNVKKDDFPVLKLFLNGHEDPVDFPIENEFTIESLKAFIQKNSGVYIGLPGCLEIFDKLAIDFVKAEKGGRKKILDKAQEHFTQANKQDQNSAKVYLAIMKKVITESGDFITTETQRVQNISKGKLAPKKQVEIQERLNILKSFEIKKKDEL